jgi:L,D-peptidoglycan transpeptidase YkuD (ErfK/YbiS/YcfS/YnhG family)
VLCEPAVRSFALLLALLQPAIAGTARAAELPVVPITTSNRQLLVVRSSSWYAASGVLVQFERNAESQWVLRGTEIPVSLGRNGMAWGRGVNPPVKTGPMKREGDGKSPAGIFPLERAFGVAEALPAGAHGFPYLHSLPSTYCVEEVRSDYYNQIVDSNEVKQGAWQKWSELRRTDGLFDWGVIVRQNAPETMKAAGSCVFLHVWRGPRIPTSGCTAMAREQIQTILRWLDPKATPLLVQLPELAYDKLRGPWALP